MQSILQKLYKKYHLSHEEESTFRDIIYEYIELLENVKDKEHKDIKEFINIKILLLEKDFDTKHAEIGAIGVSAQSHHLNILFNQIKRLKSLQEKQDKYNELITNLFQDVEYRKNIKCEIESIDYESNPNFWSSSINNLLSFFGARPK